jgi:hypothetical protein
MMMILFLLLQLPQIKMTHIPGCTLIAKTGATCDVQVDWPRSWRRDPYVVVCEILDKDKFVDVNLVIVRERPSYVTVRFVNNKPQTVTIKDLACLSREVRP